MKLLQRLRALDQVPAVRTALFLLGCLLLVLTPFVGVLPGPGGVFVFAAGAALVLKYSSWAKRRYVRFQRRYPSAASWCDWALRRPSARRREVHRHRNHARTTAAAAREKELVRISRHDGQAQLVLVREQIGIGYFIERRFIPDGAFVHEAYWAVIGFSRLYPDLATAHAEGLRALERVD
jgi:hypothetical protein